MLKYDEKASQSNLYEHVKLAPLNAIQRTIALNALRETEAVSNGIMWVINGIKRLTARAGAGFGHLKHDH
jgi:hypothetical protein